jgi:surfeit locus 1 family protein
MLTRRWWFLLVVTLAVSALTTRLGFWQLGRAQQKESIYAQQQSQMQAPPLTTAELVGQPSSTESLYRRVDLQGEWMPGFLVYLANRSLNGQPGFQVLTPLRLQGNVAVLVVRGWAPRDWVDSNKLPEVQTPAGEVHVQGFWMPAPSHMLELAAQPTESPQGGGFQSLRQNIDVAAYGRDTGLEIVATVQEVGQASQGLTRQMPNILSGADKNRAYAAQWFALSALCLGLFVWFQIIQKLRHG